MVHRSAARARVCLLTTCCMTPSSLWRQPLDEPSHAGLLCGPAEPAPREPFVDQPIVQPVGATLPELDGLGDEPEPTPVRRYGDVFVVGPPFLDLSHALF